jgi:hypothetical protein
MLEQPLATSCFYTSVIRRQADPKFGISKTHFAQAQILNDAGVEQVLPVGGMMQE